MSERKQIDLGLESALDELFMTDQGRAENRLPKIYDIAAHCSEISTSFERNTFPSAAAIRDISSLKHRMKLTALCGE